MSVQLKVLLMVRLKCEIKGCTWSYNRVALEYAHGDRLVCPKEFTKQLNKSILEEAPYVALEGAPKISLSEAQKIAKKCKEKDAFDVAVDGSLDDAIKGTHLNLKFGSLSILYILYSAEQTELLTFSN